LDLDQVCHVAVSVFECCICANFFANLGDGFCALLFVDVDHYDSAFVDDEGASDFAAVELVRNRLIKSHERRKQ
jgi:hypothetical protein